ncbi:MAG: N-methyl-L-tryptophan oxidase [Elusimicrobia bacterium]|nr:N-methyl-L-tryptophan oxidase [Elusimicrobiota bacterium]
MKNSVIIVGGGIMGASAAYSLTRLGKQVTVLDMSEVPNRHAASGDQLRTFRLTYGKDAFYTDMAAKALPLWLDLCAQSSDKFLVQHGFLDLAVKAHGYVEHCLQMLKEHRIPCQVLQKEDIRRHYPMMNSRAFRFGLLHKDGGLIWAMRAVSTILGLAQRKGCKVRTHTQVAALVKSKGVITAVKDSAGRLHEAGHFLFAPGAWTSDLLKPYRLPLKVTRQQQLYLRPPFNRGRYRQEHFPPFYVQSQGFYGVPMHIHGFMKIAENRKGPPGKPGDVDEREITPQFEKKVRAFLKRFIPELAGFSEHEGHVCYYTSTKDDDFIMDRLPDASNGYLMAGFSGHGFKFAPLLGQAMAQLIVGGKSDLNLHRFRLNRF